MLRALLLGMVLALAAADVAAADDVPPQPTSMPPELPPPGPPDAPPRAVAGTHNCANYYPPLSAQLFESGRVQLRYDVAADGGIGNVTLDISSGSDRLDNAALACVRERWKEVPALRNSVPVSATGLRAIVAFTSPPPTTVEDFTTRAGAYMMLGKARLAVADYTSAIALNPKDARLYWSRSDAYMVLRETGRATADRAKADEISQEIMRSDGR